MLKISVIVPVYNAERFLPECLDSILSQSINDIEVICVDDCGNDNSGNILKEYALKDDRVKIINYNQNMGLSYARNRGLENAKGKYILFVDSDDMITDDSLYVLYNKAEETQADGVMFDLDSIYEGSVNRSSISEFGQHKYDYPGIYTGQELFTIQSENDDLQLMSVLCMWRNEFLKDSNLFFHEGFLHEDNPFTICALMYAKRMCFLKRKCYIYRRVDESITVKLFGYKNLIGLTTGNVDVMQALTDFSDGLNNRFSLAVADFIFMVRKLVRKKIIDMICGGEDIILPTTSKFSELMEWKIIIGADYKYIDGIMNFSVFKRLSGYRKIFVYGGGKIGLEVVRLLEEFGIRNYQILVSNNLNGYGWSANAIEACKLKECLDYDLVIVSVGVRLERELVSNARDLGFKNITTAKALFTKNK